MKRKRSEKRQEEQLDVGGDGSDSSKSANTNGSELEETVSNASLVNVEFEYFDPQSEYDFHAIRNLLKQLFESDSHLLDLGALTDLVLSQPLLGSTVKVDGNSSDPYAFLTVVNLNEHKDHPAVSALIGYLLERADDIIRTKLESLIARKRPSVGLILHERLINMPFEVAPPMYKMLLEEIQWALDENEPYDFDTYVLISKTFSTVKETRDRKRKETQRAAEIFYAHPEDECLRASSSHSHQFSFRSKPVAMADKAGIRVCGTMMLFTAEQLAKGIERLEAISN